MSKQGRFFEELTVGEVDSMAFPVTEDAIVKFAEVSHDDNPVHLDEAFAAKTQFGTRIAHGMLSAAFISAMVGTRLPGYGSIYLSQTLKFRRPVKIGDEVVVTATVKELNDARAWATIETICSVDGKSVIEGEALVMVPRKGA